MKKMVLHLLVFFCWVAVAMAGTNINTAGQGELQSLPGIGATKAEAIIKYREEHGPFKTVDELTNVSGIGEKSLDKIKDLIEVGN